MQVLERELIILIFATTSFASVSSPFSILNPKELTSVLDSWTCLGIRLANLARREFDPFASTIDIFSGKYIEAWVCALTSSVLRVS